MELDDAQPEETVYRFPPQVIKWLRECGVLKNDETLDLELLRETYTAIQHDTIVQTKEGHDEITAQRNAEQVIKRASIGLFFVQLSLMQINSTEFSKMVAEEEDKRSF